MKKNTPGCATTDCCGPCCAVVWGYLLDDYTTLSFIMTGNDTVLLSPSPWTQTKTLVATLVSGGITFYICFDGAGNSEQIVNVSDYYAPANPRRIGRPGVVDPSTGLTTYIYSSCGGGIQATVCEPTPTIKITVTCSYSVKQTASPTAAITGAGYVLDPTWGGSGDRYKKVSGDTTHYVTQDNADPQVWHIDSTYEKSVVGAANLMSGFPSTINVTPAWNPFGMSSEMTLS